MWSLLPMACFFVIMMLSVVLGFSSSSIFIAWVSLEMNLMSFLIVLHSNFQEAPFVSMKYFLIQSVGSSVFLLGAVWLSNFHIYFSSVIIFLALLWKLGAAPFQGWLLNMVKQLSWVLFFILGTFQKILPLFLAFELVGSYWSTYAGLAVMVAVMGALSESNLKKMIIYSSALAIAWMLSASSVYETLFYLSIYSVSFFLLALLFYKTSSFNLESEGTVTLTNSSALVLLVLLLSLIGVPPLLGFYPKLVILMNLLKMNLMMETGLLLMGSAFFILVYIRFCLVNLELSQSSMVGHSNFGLDNTILLLPVVSGMAFLV